ncbi:MAG: tRNA dihydrouridine synthase DusB [Bdellovibrionales bacterium]|nr:tRNA dihydrouridine synthase DusB [Bdellovibrionales bacterium]
MHLGPFEIEHPFILAPMAGITHSPFRRLMRRHRSAVVISELVSATGIEYAGARTLDLLKYHEEERRVGLQIFGEDQEHLVKACQYVERLGADFVDLNMGCPVPKVVKKGAGSAMCRDPMGLSKILHAMVKSVRIPVTIKIRTGWDAQTRNASEIVRVAADAGVKWVAIHGRTRAQGYSGEADWDFIGDIRAKSALPIIGNGDVSTAEDAVKKYRTYGVDAVMIGRGALRNPFLFEQCEAVLKGQEPKRPQISDYIALMHEQRSLLEQTFPARMAMVHARKFLAWYSAGFPGCHEYRRKLFTITDPEVVWSETFEFFERNGRDRSLDFMSQPFLMGGHG